MQPHGADPDRFLRVTLLAAAAVLGASLCVPVPAQQSNAPPKAPQTSAAGRDIPTPDQLEPGVNTTPASEPAPPAAAPAKAPAAPAPAAPAPSVATQQNAASPKEPTAAKNAPRKGGPDRIELDTTDITGNRELPKVLYIVPWKRSDLGDLVGKPVNSLLDEALQPLDRDVFQRENRYYDALKPGADGAKGGAAQSSDNKP